MLEGLPDEEYQNLVRRMEDLIAEKDRPAVTVEGKKGFLYVYSPGVLSVTIYGNCRWRQKGRRFKGSKIFAIGEEEIVVHVPFNLLLEMLIDIGAEEKLSDMENLILKMNE